jgi:succinate dehydrogenase/fumarate reductase flavoprotein subunit
VTDRPITRDEEADLVLIGYGLAGATAAVTACDADAQALLIRKPPERHKAGNSRVTANIVSGPMPSSKLRSNTQAGPRCKMDVRVTGIDGEPISGLCSAGELGSIYSLPYQGGGNIGECVAFGRIAGANAANECPRIADPTNKVFGFQYYYRNPSEE